MRLVPKSMKAIWSGKMRYPSNRPGEGYRELHVSVNVILATTNFIYHFCGLFYQTNLDERESSYRFKFSIHRRGKINNIPYNAIETHQSVSFNNCRLHTTRLCKEYSET